MPTTTRQRWLLAGIAGALVLLVAGAYGYEWYASGPGSARKYAVTIVRDGRTLQSFELGDLEKLGMKTVTLQGQPQTGPTLLSVLHAAGVSSFTTLTVNGMGVRDGGRLELARSSVGDTVLLDIAKRGTTKIVGPGISYQQRVRDVLAIEVR